MTVEIRETRLGGNLRPFLEVVGDIYRNDPHYVRPLDFELKDRLDPKAPFWKHAEGTLLTAWRNGRCVGRCTAHIDREHLARHKDGVGMFGLFDTTDDAEAAKALLDRAGEWVKRRGMKALRGPLSLSVNDELGCLVEGFDTPPQVMMPHHRPYQGGLIEAAGLPKIKDLFAWQYEAGKLPERARKGHAAIQAMPEVRCRPMDMKHLKRDVALLMDIYNDAWSDNWGFVPMTRAEVDKLASDMKLIAIPDLTQIVEIDGEAMAVAVALPNLNEALVGLDGKLLPTGLAKLVWRLKIRGVSSARVIVLGIRRKLRNVRKYAALSTFMYVQMHLSGARHGLRRGELSWTLEDNHAVNAGIKLMGGKVYKRYRLYQREL